MACELCNGRLLLAGVPTSVIAADDKLWFRAEGLLVARVLEGVADNSEWEPKTLEELRRTEGSLVWLYDEIVEEEDLYMDDFDFEFMAMELSNFQWIVEVVLFTLHRSSRYTMRRMYPSCLLNPLLETEEELRELEEAERFERRVAASLRSRLGSTPLVFRSDLSVTTFDVIRAHNERRAETRRLTRAFAKHCCRRSERLNKELVSMPLLLEQWIPVQQRLQLLESPGDLAETGIACDVSQETSVEDPSSATEAYKRRIAAGLKMLTVESHFRASIAGTTDLAKLADATFAAELDAEQYYDAVNDVDFINKYGPWLPSEERLEFNESEAGRIQWILDRRLEVMVHYADVVAVLCETDDAEQGFRRAEWRSSLARLRRRQRETAPGLDRALADATAWGELELALGLARRGARGA
jgi:hypothetical protein